jgi:hypothetical protein
VSRYADRIDVLKNPMLRVGTPIVLFDRTDGSQIALNSCDATEWVARDPKRFSRTATGDEMEKQIGLAPQAITGNLVLWDRSGVAQACWMVSDTVSGNTFILPTVDAVEWMARSAQYQRVFP